VAALVALAAGLSTIASATIGVTSLVLGGVIPHRAAVPKKDVHMALLGRSSPNGLLRLLPSFSMHAVVQ
jgi:hypothetical protein